MVTLSQTSAVEDVQPEDVFEQLPYPVTSRILQISARAALARAAAVSGPLFTMSVQAGAVWRFPHRN
jgi:hypothetical protein